MSIVKIQINHKINLDKIELSSYLYDEIGEEYDLSEDEIESSFEIENVFKLPNDTFISIFTIDFPDLALRDLEPKDVVKSYLDTLNHLEGVIGLVKLQDDFLQKIANQYFNRLFIIEMELRNVLTYILTYDEKPIEKGTFNEFGVKLAESFENQNVTENYENGLYYILFNHYASFGEPKKLTSDQISSILQEVSLSDFEDFKKRLQKRYISETRHTEFLFSIMQKLKPLEDMRNAVMHIRNLSDNKVANFEKAFNDSGSDKGMQTLIEEFWKREKSELDEKTWLTLAEQLIINLIKIRKSDGSTDYEMVDSYYDYEFEQSYSDIEEFRQELIDYLRSKDFVPEFDADEDGFEDKINGLINKLLVQA